VVQAACSDRLQAGVDDAVADAEHIEPLKL
jgi:hypothetical protein